MVATAAARCTHSVHPRACGEHSALVRGNPLKSGSSPRLRGTWRRKRLDRRTKRFIPAPAGNIETKATTPQTASVHPRACGEHKTVRLSKFLVNGSSPRLRGTCANSWSPEQACRFIPAPAGNMPRARTAPTGPSVHPRACGEHSAEASKKWWNCGSSPRLRGTYTQGACDELD